MTADVQIPGASRAILLDSPRENTASTPAAPPLTLVPDSEQQDETSNEPATVEALPNNQDTEPMEAVTPNADSDEDDEESPAEPEPESEMPPEPDEPEYIPEPDPPEFKGVEWVGYLFGASILFSVIGQVLFWGSFFTSVAATQFPGMSSAVPWGVAVALGGLLEAGMVVFSDLGMKRRAVQSRWVPWFLVGIAIAVFCIGINVAHWWHSDPTAAITFGAVGAMGFVAHLAKGLTKSEQHIRDRHEVQQRNQRQQELYEQKLDAWRAAQEQEQRRRHEREMARIKGSAPRQRDSAGRGAAKPAGASKRSKRGGTRKGPPRLGRDEALRWASQNGTPGQRPEPTVVRRHFQERGYAVPDLRTIRRWFAESPAESAS